MDTIETDVQMSVAPNTTGNAFTICAAAESAGTDVTLKYALPQCEYMYGCACTAVGMLLGYYDLYGYMGYDVSNAIDGTVSVLSRGTDGNKYNMNAFDTTLGNFVATQGYKSRFYQQTKETELPNTYINSSPQNGLNTPVFDSIADWIGTGQYWRGSTDTNTLYTISNLKSLQETTATYPIDNLQVPYQYLDIKWGLNEYLKTKGYSLNSVQTETVFADTQTGGTFSFERYKAEIDAGRPVLISICTAQNAGHMVVGYGYNDSTQEIIFDDLYNTDCRMNWNGSYTYGGSKYYVNAVTTMIFNVAGLQKIKEGVAESYCITVDPKQTGTYELAKNTVSPEFSVTIRDTDGTEIGDANLKDAATTDTRKYELLFDEKKNTYSLKISEHDGVAPTVTVSADPDNENWTKDKVAVSAEFTDNVGVVEKQYKIGDAMEWTDYETTISVTENNTTVYFQAKDAAGNVGYAQYIVTNIDKTAPTIDVTYSPTTWTYDDVEVSVSSFDGESGVKSVLYSLNAQDWLLYEDVFTISENGMIYFKCEDNVGNVAEASIEVDCLTQDLLKSTMTISEDTECMKNLVGLKTLNVKKGVSFYGYSLKVVNNSVSINVSDYGSVNVNSIVSDEPKSKVSVSLKKETDFAVRKDFIDVYKISSGTGSSVTIEGSLIGTESSNTLSFGKSSENKMSSIDLMDGFNRISFDSLSTTEITGAVCSVYNLSVKKGTAEKTKGGVVVTPAQYTTLSLETLSGTNHNDTLEFQDYTKTRISGKINLTLDGNDTVKIGKHSSFDVESILFCGDDKSKNTVSIGLGSVMTISGNIENVHNVTLSSGKLLYETTLIVKSITGSDFSDTFTVWNNCIVNLSGNLELEAGNDSIKIGKECTFTTKDIDLGDGKNSFSVGSYSTVDVGDIDFLYSLTVSSGKAPNVKKSMPAVYTEFLSGNIVCTNNNDSLTFGNYVKATVGSIDFGNGTKDKLKVGTNSSLEICGKIDGLDIAYVGKDSSVAASDITLEKIRMAGKKGSISKTAEFISIGVDDTIAATFKGIDMETADNDIDNIATLDNSFTGWLSAEDPNALANYYNDNVDYFNLSGVSAENLGHVSVHCENGNALQVVVFGKDEFGNWDEGTVIEMTDNTWQFENITATEYAIAVSLSEDFKLTGGVVNYQVTVLPIA